MPNQMLNPQENDVTPFIHAYSSIVFQMCSTKK